MPPACPSSPLTNGNFETGSYSSWTVYNPIGGAAGSWSIAAGQDGTHGSYVAQVSVLNPDTSRYGGFVGFISQSISTCAGTSYTATFQYQCLQIASGAYAQLQVDRTFGSAFSCAALNTWATGSLTWTAASTSSTFYMRVVQNGNTKATFQFDNIVITRGA